MGATETKERILNERVFYKYDRLNIDQLDKIYNDSFPIVKDIEVVRCKFILKWNEFVRLCGAIVLVNPGFESCIQGMLWKLATDLNGKISSVLIYEAERFIEINEPSRTEDQILLQSFQEVCRFYVDNDENVRRLESEIDKYRRETNELRKDLETLLTDKYNVRPIDVYSYQNKINANNKKIYTAYKVIVDIRKIFDDIQRGLINYSIWTKSKDRQRRIEEVAASAIQKKYTKASKIFYKFSKEEKVSNYDDHADLVQDDLKAEKEAKYVLLELGVPMNNVLRKGKKEERLTTGGTAISAMRKETEASGTEVIEQEQPMETREGNILPEKTITYKYVEDSNNYNVDNVKFSGKTDNFSKEKISGYTVEKISKPEVRDLTDQKESDQSIYRISRDKFKRNMTMPDSKDKEERVLPGKETLIRSMTYEQPDLRASTMTIDVESLQREVENLRRENKTLNEKLTQSTMRGEEIQLIKKPSYKIEEKLSEETFRVFNKHHIPLKSWALTLRKSLKLSEKTPKCLEVALDKELIIVGGKTGKITFYRFLNFSDIREQASLQVSHEAVYSLLYLHDGMSLLVGCKDGVLAYVDMNKFSHKIIYEFEGPIRAIINPLKGSNFFVSAGKKIIDINIQNRIINASIDAHDEDVTCMAYNEKKEILCSGGKDNNVKIWNSDNLDCLGVLQGHISPLTSMCFAQSQTHSILCSVSKDSSLIFWNLTDKNLTKYLTCDSPAKKIFYLEDKKSVVTIHNSGFYLLNIEKTEEKFFSSEYPYASGCYYDDGHNVLMVTKEGILEFWNSK
jgi:WD40 repeat protein